MTTGTVEPGRGNVVAAPGHAGGPLPRCLSLDLEVGKLDGRIHSFAGVRPDLDRVLTFPARRATLSAALAKLDELSDGADFVLGHNLIGFDLPHPQAASPQLRLLQLPAVDTLRLNPLAFPKNPSLPREALPRRAAEAGAGQRPRAGCQAGAGGVRKSAEGPERDIRRPAGVLALADHGGRRCWI